MFYIFQVTRHIEKKGGAHEIALELEKGIPKEDHVLIGEGTRGLVQKRVNVMNETTKREAYVKLFRTAYELAMNPTLPMNQFKTLVKVQKQNGVRLIEGTYVCIL